MPGRRHETDGGRVPRWSPLQRLTLGSAALSLAAALWTSRSGRPGRRTPPDEFVVAGGALIGTVAIAITELVAPSAGTWSTGRSSRRIDGVYMFVTGPPTAAAAALASRHLGRWGRRALARRAGVPEWPDRWPLPARIALALLLTELVHYWHHRISHEVDVLWSAHSVHHSADAMSWTNSLRFHPVDHFTLLTAQSALLAALGTDPAALVGHSVFKGIHGQIQHANVAGGTGRFGLVLSTAEQHRWHHATAEGPGGVNYGAVLSIWDRVFRTYAAADGPGPESTGLAEAPAAFATARGQLAAPFRVGAARRDRKKRTVHSA